MARYHVLGLQHLTMQNAQITDCDKLDTSHDLLTRIWILVSPMFKRFESVVSPWLFFAPTALS